MIGKSEVHGVGVAGRPPGRRQRSVFTGLVRRRARTGRALSGVRRRMGRIRVRARGSPTPCGSAIDRAGGAVDACVLHAAVLLASLECDE